MDKVKVRGVYKGRLGTYIMSKVLYLKIIKGNK